MHPTKEGSRQRKLIKHTKESLCQCYVVYLDFPSNHTCHRNYRKQTRIERRGSKIYSPTRFCKPCTPNRLFKEKITVEKARANLIKILDEIKDSPHSIYTQLDFRGTERLDLKYLKESISEALKSEKRFHKLESGIIFLLALVLLTPAFRAFIASMFALPACFNATDVLPPKEMFEMGWGGG